MTTAGQIWISAVIYVLVAVTITVIVIEAGLPILDQMRERSAFARGKDALASLDQHIEDVAGEGQGSRRIVPIDLSDGELRFEDSRIRWKLETSSPIIEPRSRRAEGNLVVGSGVDVSASQTSDYHILENSRIRANFSRYGNVTAFVPITTAGLLNTITFKSADVTTNGSFFFVLNDTNASTVGTGYTSLEDAGTGLTSGVLRAHINSTPFAYDILFTLESGADFMTTSIENFKRH